MGLRLRIWGVSRRAADTGGAFQRGDAKVPRGLRAARIRLEDDEFAVLTFPLAPITLPDSLTEAERSVARALLAGESNAQIAAARHTSVRTIASQVSSLMRKLRVQSRAEALALLFQTGVRAKQRPS